MLSRKWEMRIQHCGLVNLALDFGKTMHVLPEKASFRKSPKREQRNKGGRSGICPGKQEFLPGFMNVSSVGRWAGSGLWYLTEEEEECELSSTLVQKPLCPDLVLVCGSKLVESWAEFGDV